MTFTASGVRLAARQALRRPAVWLGAVLSLALGIGANTAIFSVLHAVVLRPLPYVQPDELVIVWETSVENPARWVAPANFVDWRRQARSFASLAAFDGFRPTMTRLASSETRAGGTSVPWEPEVVRAVSASGTFFTTLGVTAALGRTLVPDDDRPGAEPVAVLSASLWRRAFGGADALGRRIALDGLSFTVIGVMPDEFQSPLQSSDVDLWVSGDRGVPRTFPFGGDITTVRDSHIIYVLGRLAPGVRREEAQHEMTALMQSLARDFPDTNTGLGANVQSLHEAVVGDVAPLLRLLQLAVVLMLLIACANVAHLLLSQASDRQGEMATRVALGAGRARLVGQLLVETLVIAIPGGVVGTLLAKWGLQALVVTAPAGLPRVQEIAIDGAVLAFTGAATLGTAILFGLWPALQLVRATPVGHAQSASRVSGSRRVRRWQLAIVAAELAAAHVLLIGAGLLVASLLAAQRVPLGFDPQGRVGAELNLAPGRYLRMPSPDQPFIDPTAKLQFIDSVISRVQHATGVRGAAASFTAPLAGAPNRGILVEGRPPRAPGLQDAADFQAVTPDFFRTVGATLVRGRHFTDHDTADALPVAIVNRTFADTYFGGTDPIGNRITFGGSLTHEIVGVIDDIRHRSVESPADPTFYFPVTQNAERWPFLSFTVWTAGDVSAAAAALRASIREADPHQAITRIRSYDESVDAALAGRRFNTTLAVVFAATAFVLAAVGIYGVMACAVSARTRELGLRAALGAAPADLLRLVVGEGARITAIAVLMGVTGGVALAGIMRAWLFAIAPREPSIFALVAAGLTAVALAATWLPARRAARANPIAALQER